MQYIEMVGRHLVQALVIGAIAVMWVELRVFSPQRDEIMQWEQRMNTFQSVVETEPTSNTVEKSNRLQDIACSWHQRGLEKRMVGEFHHVVNCIQQEHGEAAVASFHLEKHLLGVRVEIVLEERGM